MKLNNIIENMPNHSRVWIYTSSREFDPNEVMQIESAGNAFTQEWQVHGKNLTASMQVVYNRFIVFAVDEKVEAASGCSIDRSVGFITEAEKNFKVSLLDKLNLAFRNSENKIEVSPMAQFQEKIEKGEVTKETIVFNNLVENLGDMRTRWETPCHNSWHMQLFS